MIMISCDELVFYPWDHLQENAHIHRVGVSWKLGKKLAISPKDEVHKGLCQVVCQWVAFTLWSLERVNVTATVKNLYKRAPLSLAPPRCIKKELRKKDGMLRSWNYEHTTSTLSSNKYNILRYFINRCPLTSLTTNLKCNLCRVSLSNTLHMEIIVIPPLRPVRLQ